MTTTNTTPATTAIDTAARNGYEMHGKYTSLPVPGKSGLFFVQHNIEGLRCYVVDTNKGTCTCPAFDRTGICKHQWFQADTARLEEMEAHAEELGWIDFAEVVSENGAEWPICPYHGAYEEAANGTPMSVCDGCMRRL